MYFRAVCFNDQFFSDFSISPKAILKNQLKRSSENQSKNCFFEPNSNRKLINWKKSVPNFHQFSNPVGKQATRLLLPFVSKIRAKLQKWYEGNATSYFAKKKIQPRVLSNDKINSPICFFFWENFPSSFHLSVFIENICRFSEFTKLTVIIHLCICIIDFKRFLA